MGQLFSNLLGNAITYGDPAQPIRVVARTIDGVFELAVVNYGEPISGKAMEKLFEPYTRGDRPEPAGPGARALYRFTDRKGAWRLTERHFESATRRDTFLRCHSGPTPEIATPRSRA